MPQRGTVGARGIGCGSSIHRRNSEWHLFDINGVAGVITGGSANILSNNLYDRFGVEMYFSGSAATQWRFLGRFIEEEGLVAGAGGGGDVLVGRGVALYYSAAAQPVSSCVGDCIHQVIGRQSIWLKRLCIGACMCCGVFWATVIGTIACCSPCFACLGLDVRILYNCIRNCETTT